MPGAVLRTLHKHTKQILTTLGSISYHPHFPAVTLQKRAVSLSLSCVSPVAVTEHVLFCCSWPVSQPPPASPASPRMGHGDNSASPRPLPSSRKNMVATVMILFVPSSPRTQPARTPLAPRPPDAAQHVLAGENIRDSRPGPETPQCPLFLVLPPPPQPLPPTPLSSPTPLPRPERPVLRGAPVH